MIGHMKAKQIKKYLNKLVVYETVWGTTQTGILTKVDRYFATFVKENGDKICIKTFNISKIKC